MNTARDNPMIILNSSYGDETDPPEAARTYRITDHKGGEYSISNKFQNFSLIPSSASFPISYED